PHRSTGHGYGLVPCLAADFARSFIIGTPGTGQPARSLRGFERVRELGHFVVDVAVFGKGSPGTTVPVAGIAEIAFDQVHDAVRPAAELRFVVLGDFVRLLPFALLEITDRSIERHDLENSVST